MSKARLAPAVLLAAAAAPAGRAAEPAGSAEFFETKVRPILVEHCLKCHGDTKGKAPKGGLRADSRAGLLKGGDSGPAIVPGEPNQSRFIEAVNFQNPELQMPPKGKLPNAVIADLTAWIRDGANWPGDGTPVAAIDGSFNLAKRKSEHWAWQPLRPRDPPAVRDTAWPAGPVDRFVLAKLDAHGIRPAGPAERRAWLRRVTFDLIGLPPSAEEVQAYREDTSADA